MTKQKVPAKELIMEAAIGLFHTNGYNGTSIRDIARKANVNSANISYYFLENKVYSNHVLSIFLKVILLVWKKRLIK